MGCADVSILVFGVETQHAVSGYEGRNEHNTLVAMHNSVDGVSALTLYPSPPGEGL